MGRRRDSGKAGETDGERGQGRGWGLSLTLDSSFEVDWEWEWELEGRDSVDAAWGRRRDLEMAGQACCSARQGFEVAESPPSPSCSFRTGRAACEGRGFPIVHQLPDRCSCCSPPTTTPLLKRWDDVSARMPAFRGCKGAAQTHGMGVGIRPCHLSPPRRAPSGASPERPVPPSPRPQVSDFGLSRMTGQAGALSDASANGRVRGAAVLSRRAGRVATKILSCCYPVRPELRHPSLWE